MKLLTFVCWCVDCWRVYWGINPSVTLRLKYLLYPGQRSFKIKLS